jgi:hypothetical protein
VLLSAQPSSGQLPGASPATLGTANNYMVLARGFAAVGLNPANLGSPQAPGFTLAIFPTTVSQSLDPLTLSDLKDYEGVVVPAAVREDWLQKISAAGGQTGRGTLEITEFSFSWTNFGAQLSTIASGYTDLNEAAAELLFFGNAGRTGEPGDFDLQGSGLTSFAVTTLGVSAGFPLARRWVPGVQQGLSIGATLKQSWGHALVFAEDSGTLARSDPLEIEMDFPVVQPDGDWREWSRGSGIGLDVGLAWERGPWAAAAVVQNLVNTFEWDLAKLVYRPGEAVFNDDTNESDFDKRPVTEAPASVQGKVKALEFRPVIALGGAYDALENLTLTAEFRQRSGEGLVTGPKTHLGVGMEYLPSPTVPVRAGLAFVTGGFQMAGGLGLALGPLHLGLAASYQKGDVDEGLAGTVGISFGGG